MSIRIGGKLRKLTREEVRLATNWALRELVGEKQAKNIQCYIRFVPQKSMAASDELGDMDNYKNDPNKFKIRIVNANSRVRQLRTLFHELGHVDQYVSGRLKDHSKNEANWKSKIVSFDDSTYNNDPWEIDADRQAKRLYKAYGKFLGKYGLTFRPKASK